MPLPDLFFFFCKAQNHRNDAMRWWYSGPSINDVRNFWTPLSIFGSDLWYKFHSTSLYSMPPCGWSPLLSRCGRYLWMFLYMTNNDSRCWASSSLLRWRWRRQGRRTSWRRRRCSSRRRHATSRPFRRRRQPSQICGGQHFALSYDSTLNLCAQTDRVRLHVWEPWSQISWRLGCRFPLRSPS